MTELQRIANRIASQGGQAFLVGGAVRDMVLGRESKDLDVEVFGMDAETLVSILREFGKVDTVGVSFGVIKLTTAENDFDFSLPRVDNKTGQGHRGFTPKVDPNMRTRDAAARRDFTFNALMLDLSSGRLIDHFGGVQDLTQGIIRATSDHFVEDPLRVLRGFQFAGRFELLVESQTAKMCFELLDEFDTLATERVWGEFEKWALKSVCPSMGLTFLRRTSWISLFPELASMVGLEQDREWHPEGDCWEHTLQSVDVAVEIATRDSLDDEERLVLVFAALLHDVGKAQTTEACEDGHVRSRSHDTAGVELAQSFLQRIGAPSWLVERVLPLVREHMFHVHTRRPSARSIRRLSHRLAPSSVHELAWVMEVDHSARQPLPQGRPAFVERMLELAHEQACAESPVADILMGRHLIALGFVPGPQFGVILRQAREAQLDGVFHTLEEATEWVRATL